MGLDSTQIMKLGAKLSPWHGQQRNGECCCIRNQLTVCSVVSCGLMHALSKYFDRDPEYGDRVATAVHRGSHASMKDAN